MKDMGTRSPHHFPQKAEVLPEPDRRFLTCIHDCQCQVTSSSISYLAATESSVSLLIIAEIHPSSVGWISRL